VYNNNKPHIGLPALMQAGQPYRRHLDTRGRPFADQVSSAVLRMVLCICKIRDLLLSMDPFTDNQSRSRIGIEISALWLFARRPLDLVASGIMQLHLS
jgi:hypothetical protein